jgi:hypothetical protein
MLQKIKAIAAVLIILALLAIVGEMDYEDELAQRANCLNMVERGLWPAGVCE